MPLAFLFHYLMINMFRMLIHPSLRACDLFVGLFHGLYCSGSMCVGVMVWFGLGGVVSLCRLKHLFHYQDDARSNKHKILELNLQIFMLC
jgi:tRNA(Arg) A34 adenosine deaminase TadA